MSSTRTRTHLPVFRSVALAIVLSGTAIGGLASTASAGANNCQTNPASCTVTTAPPLVVPHPGDNPDLPVTDAPHPTHPGDNPDKPVSDKPHGTDPSDDPDLPVADKPHGTDPSDDPDLPVADKPHGDKPVGDPGADQPNGDQDAPTVEVSTVDAPVVASANFTG